jgi:hypothetical protein
VQHTHRTCFVCVAVAARRGARDMMNRGSVAVPRHRLTRLSFETHMSRGDMTTLALAWQTTSLRSRRLSLCLTLFASAYGVRRIVRTRSCCMHGAHASLSYITIICCTLYVRACMGMAMDGWMDGAARSSTAAAAIGLYTRRLQHKNAATSNAMVQLHSTVTACVRSVRCLTRLSRSIN